MAIDPETQKRLLDLVYDLLPEEEADELRRQIDSDAELARAYEEARQSSRLFAEAARLESPKIAWKRPPVAPAAPRPARDQARQARASHVRALVARRQLDDCPDGRHPAGDLHRRILLPAAATPRHRRRSSAASRLGSGRVCTRARPTVTSSRRRR